MIHEKSPHELPVTKLNDSQRFGLLRAWTIADLFDHAEGLVAEGKITSASTLYKDWIACNGDHQLLHAAYFNYGVALDKSGDRLGAINAIRECIRLRPDFQPAYINLGRLLEDVGQAKEAVTQWQTLTGRLQEITGAAVKNKLLVLQQLGRVLEGHQVDGPAEDALRQSLEISNSQPEVIQHWIALRQRQCKWPVVAGWEHAPAAILMAGISPLSLANLIDDPMFQLSRAWKYHKESIKPVGNPRALPVHSPSGRPESRRLRIGYVSSDLREHAVGFAMTDVFEEHDRSGFEIFAYYCGIDRVDPTQIRSREGVDHWLDIRGLSDEQAAAKIGEDKIDILVDLNGYTKDARTRVFSLRPAPIAVNWFGFPGTMGTPYHHYIVADEHIIPEGDEIYYSEKVVRLPCYQPNDRKRKISANIPARSAENLPEEALVYCCLNGMQKITFEAFTLWMTILKEVPGSVLWLLGSADEIDARLMELAKQSGVSPERLIFARKKPNPEHVARYALADLFLDTFPYGAHTTAADALWMGVPVLTISGRTFASRVCASLLSASQANDLICSTKEIYAARAIELGRHPERIAELKRRLIDGRQSSLLFDTPRLVHELENLYRTMWAEFQDGRRPVPDLSNLDIYHEIGVELALDNAALSVQKDLRPLYRDRLGRRDCVSPVKFDSRLWSNGI